MKNIGIFLAGAVLGAVGLGLTACLVEGFPSSSDYGDKSEDNKNIAPEDYTENSTCLNTEEAETVQKTEEQAAQPKNDKLEKIRNAAEVLLEVLSKEKLYTTVN